MAKLPLKIFTPYGKYLESDVDLVVVQTTDMKLGILPNHTDLISPVTVSVLEITTDGKKEYYAVGGGLLKIEQKVCTLLLNSIENENDIDLERALNAKERAETRLATNKDIDVDRARLSLQRAVNRINIKNKN